MRNAPPLAGWTQVTERNAESSWRVEPIAVAWSTSVPGLEPRYVKVATPSEFVSSAVVTGFAPATVRRMT